MAIDWDKRIQTANKFFSAAKTHGQKVYTRYKDDRANMAEASGLKKANIFYSNVNTLKESLFNSLPKADVSKLHKGDYEDDASRVAALIAGRALDYEVNCAVDFKGAVEAAIMDRLVPGVGQVWIIFNMDKDAEGNPIPGTEKLQIDTVYWEDFIYQPARMWAKVGWCGRRIDMTREDIIARWGEDAAVNLPLMSETDKGILTPKEITESKYSVYEIWDKVNKKQIYKVIGMDGTLEEKDDPYQLEGFYPCPPPLLANPTTTALLPVTDYHISQDQYNELDILYARMSLIAEAIKVAGLYDAETQAIGKMLEGGENKLIPVDNWAMAMEKGGARGMIDWYPVENVATVLNHLQVQFEFIKGVLQEVSGMADIVRGDTNQYETASAQQMKAQFASVRMNGYQRDLAEFVSSILQIMGEMVCQLYADEKLQAIVGQLSEYDTQFIPQAMQVLRSDLLLHYRIRIQADSLTQADWALEKGQRMELMGFFSQFLQASIPAIAQTPALGPMLLGMLKFTLSGYKGAAEVMGMIEQQMASLLAQAQQPKPPPPPSPEQVKAQAEQQATQQQMALNQQKHDLDQQAAQQKMQNDQQQADLKSFQIQQQIAADGARNDQEAQHRQRLHELEIQQSMEKGALQLELQKQKADQQAQQQANKSAE